MPTSRRKIPTQPKAIYPKAAEENRVRSRRIELLIYSHTKLPKNKRMHELQSNENSQDNE